MRVRPVGHQAGVLQPFHLAIRQRVFQLVLPAVEEFAFAFGFQTQHRQRDLREPRMKSAPSASGAMRSATFRTGTRPAIC